QANGDAVTVRLQSGVLEMSNGSVVVANAGDLAKEAGLWPAYAMAPAPAPAAAVAPGVQDDAAPAQIDATAMSPEDEPAATSQDEAAVPSEVFPDAAADEAVPDPTAAALAETP